MGKVKRQPRKHSNHHDNPNNTNRPVVRRQHSQKQGVVKNNSQSMKKTNSSIRQKIPFTRHDNILLLGEGDFSFTLSLKLHHKVYHATSTCFDTKEILYSKYPDIGRTIAQFGSCNASSLPAEGDPQDKFVVPEEEETEWKGFSPSPPAALETTAEAPQSTDNRSQKFDILYGIDATKLSSMHKKILRPFAPFTKIVFNFPHVGGLSTDVNRQVRYNQELLVGFFKAAKGLLSSPARPAKITTQSDAYDSNDDDLSDNLADSSAVDHGAANGQILVTLFEGEPYTLWNIRDLARHSGLRVVESFKFPWCAYPGYQHARTVGDINGKDRSEEGKRKGAWRGEEREARCYVLEDKDAESIVQKDAKSKRKRHDKDDDSE